MMYYSVETIIPLRKIELMYIYTCTVTQSLNSVYKSIARNHAIVYIAC